MWVSGALLMTGIQGRLQNTPSTWKHLISQSGVWINSLPAEKRLVFLLKMFLLRNKGRGGGCSFQWLETEERRGSCTQTKSRPIFLTDVFRLWQKIALVHRLVSALNWSDSHWSWIFTSHKNLSSDVLLSFVLTHVNTHYIIHFRQKKNHRVSFRCVMCIFILPR